MQRSRGLTTAEAVRLVVDIGNTTTTLALFSDAPEPSVESASSALFGEPEAMRSLLVSLASRYGAPEAVAVCGVVPALAAACSAQIEALFSIPVVTITASLRLPFQLDYATPHTFGADRIALCAWSRHLFADRPVIAVDIGTAITFDVLDAEGNYCGGLIMPGIDMMAGALNSKTAQLPLVGIEKPQSLLGRSTGECIRNGIFWGVVRQIGGLIEAIGAELLADSAISQVEVLVTGGNSRTIAPEIPSITRLDEFAVLRGIDLLLRFNS